MKYVLIAFLLTGSMLGQTLAEQTAHCGKVLWFYQKQASLTNVFMEIKVLRREQVKEKNAWGSIEYTPGGPVIEIVALQDFPTQMSMRERKKMQEVIVRHEILHAVLKTVGVPDTAQDSLIDTLLPLVVPYAK